jgi:uncharacterized oxidoreductase
MMTLERKRILITGGGSGIGLELARRLADANQVVIAGRDEATLERARAETPALRTLRLDVTSEEDGHRAIAWLSSELGGLDLLVNNAGLLRGYPLSAPAAEANSVEDVDVNVGGSIRMTRLALPLLEASEQGAVLFVSSAVALAAVPGFAVYAATKAALHSLARSLRAELKGRGIRVFEVLPPVVDTGPVVGLDVPKLAPAVVVDAILAGIARERQEIRVGRVKQLALLARLAPRLADRIVVRALRPRRATRADRASRPA